MKNIIYICFILLSFVTFSSCEDDLNELNKGDVALSVSVSNTDTLTESDATATGITFTWTSGSNKGTGAAISYALEIAKAGTNFVKEYYVDLGQDVYSLSYTQKQLNELLLNELSASVDISANYEARITAIVANDQVKAQTATVSFKAKPYKASTSAPYSMIYFVGSFTNWNFVEMTQDPTNPCIFRYGAVLNWNSGGDFKFGTASGSWSNMYHPTESSASFSWTNVQQNDNSDYKWALTQDQCGKPYKMYIDITPGKESFHMSEFIPYKGMYMVGDATPAGWDINSAIALTAQEDYTFTWTGSLTAGSLKFTCDKQSDWNGAWFMPSENDKIWEEGSEVITFVDKSQSSTSDIDRKWKVTQAGSYTITLDQLTEKMIVKKN